MNFLVARPDLAIIEERQLPLIKTVEKYGINVIPQRLRHPRAMGGDVRLWMCAVPAIWNGIPEPVVNWRGGTAAAIARAAVLAFSLQPVAMMR